MNEFSYTSIPQEERRPTIGMIVLQTDVTIEREISLWLPPNEFNVLVSRVPNGVEVTEETLGAMADHITHSASLFPEDTRFDAVAYCCTSGTSVIGAEKVANLVKAGCETGMVTNPVTALVAACEKRGIKKLAFLSPYIESVSSHLRDVVAAEGIQSPVFGSFNEGEDSKVAWIDPASIKHAALTLAEQGGIDGLFMSCTNLKTYGLIEELEQELSMPVLSSNFVLAEHLRGAA